MDGLIKAIQLILILSIIVILHEGGHFAAARFFKTKVERFFLFFDVSFALFKKKIGDTVYGIGWLPLGGYVKIAGMIDESMDKEQMKSPPQPWEFRSKPAWQRLIIMLAGIFVNLILAILIFSVLTFTNGENFVNVNKLENGVVVDSAQLDLGMLPGDTPVGVNGERYDDLAKISMKALIDGGTLDVKRGNEIVHLPIKKQDQVEMLEAKGQYFTPNVQIFVDSILPNLPASKSDLAKGDVIKAINGKPVNGWSGVVKEISTHKNQNIQLQVESGNQAKTVDIRVNAEGKIGFSPAMKMDNIIDIREFNFFESIGKGVEKTFATITSQVQSIGMLWKLEGEATKYLSGPIGIARAMPTTWDWTFFWSFTALLSAWLAFVNILPIPGLDGGHALFTIYEMITGHKPSDKFMEIMQMVGAVILIGLMIFIFGNDIYNLIFN